MAEGKSIPAAARLAAYQLVNKHPGLADELVPEAPFGQSGAGDGVVPDVAELSSDSAIQAGREVDGGLPDFDVGVNINQKVRTPTGNRTTTVNSVRSGGMVPAPALKDRNAYDLVDGKL